MTATAIINGKVYNHETGEFTPNTILIEEDKISEVLSPTKQVPASQRFDASGLYITPGFIDTCSQIGLKEIGIRWEGHDGYEPNEQYEDQLKVIDGIYPFDQAFQDAVAGGVTAAHVVSSPDSVVGAATAVIHTHGKTVDDMLLKEQLGIIFSMGDIPKHAYWSKTGTPLTRMGIAQRIRTAIKKLKNTETTKTPLLFIRSHRADDIATAFRIANENDVPFILVHGTEFPMVPRVSLDTKYSVIAGPCFQPMERYELKNLDPSLYQTLYSQQVPFSFATDHPVSSVQHLQLEACLALRAGVPEKTIINALTIDAAKLLQIDSLTGSIQKGLLADLVFWNQHPLNLTASPVRTFIKGSEVYRKE